MTLSNAIKKEIIKTFLKNTCKPIPLICSEICKKLNQAFIKDEIVMYKQKHFKVLELGDVYKLKDIETEKIELMPFEALKRVDEHSKNDIYEFLLENTTDTVFGKILKPNVVNEIRRLEDRERKLPTEKVKLVTQNIVPSKTNSNYISNDLVAFEIFIFVIGNKKFTKAQGVDFVKFLELLKDEKYCFELVKMLFDYIKAYKREGDFFVKLQKAVRLCMLSETSNDINIYDWESKQLSQANYNEILDRFFSFCSFKSSDKRFLTLVSAEVKHKIKFLIDFVITTSEFKKYIDSTIEVTKQREKTRYEINSKLRKSTINQVKNENEKRELFAKHEEIGKMLMQERVKFALGHYKGDFYFVNDAMYRISEDKIFGVNINEIEIILKALKGAKDNAQLSQNLRQIKEIYLPKPTQT